MNQVTEDETAQMRRLSEAVAEKCHAREVARANVAVTANFVVAEATSNGHSDELNAAADDAEFASLRTFYRDKISMEYSEGISGDICASIAKGRTLKEICEIVGAPTMTKVREWLTANPDFANKMRDALELRLDVFEDEIIRDAAQAKHASTSQIAGLRLSIETRLRYLRAKRAAIWADKPQTEITIAQQFLANPPSVNIHAIKADGSFADHKREAEQRADRLML